MKYKHLTIFLGAGSSKAYERYPYPLQTELLEEIFVYADKLIDRGVRQRLYLAYAVGKAYGIDIQELKTGKNITTEVIREKYEHAKRAHKLNNSSIDEIFDKIERISDDSCTIAYWALSNAIGVYMWQMSEANISQPSIGLIDTAHRKLIDLINEFLSNGCMVSVVDFNYDCVLEFEKTGRGKNINFNWDCGRKRKVIGDITDERTPTELVEANCFREQPCDNENSIASAPSVQLIKLHGDMCIFLRGDKEIYYQGGRHSQTTTALFPKQLKDISPNDNFLRCSILPPTKSRLRHQSIYYDEERKRMISSLINCDAVLIIGWSVSGADNFYVDEFRNALGNKSSGTDIYIIDKSSEEYADKLKRRVNELFDNKAIIKNIDTQGFNEKAVSSLEKYF